MSCLAKVDVVLTAYKLEVPIIIVIFNNNKYFK
ncbi:hypothetical protein REISMN_03135 [Rickettsia tamurae subsp. buchneri]|uniref:Uncharacterized protein n=1 Tax=Rickettsia tamurae subsp. buchneri TaxID=1462938 RepID=A0A8E0WMB0_9RICK|nr:hypothetical protein REISMN_03135 [Rickettsia tamurae subsp. buchneri]